ncbi:MAG: 2-amino-4-hydroxy-6-hydroxymethyldihydropteridine diphosphokinase [Saccharospirillaceae bacterium]|nr:2-amino-4-hydroxy-6-hydroxymethyldihydropteridine diphosphokinase [Saccharospirillaceae bacterium]MCD8530618.1 2-amino-4-hydroxy-6-hydroxymethyldihydropteridine diphosphokinase [Saccharospirillaceae bacterium]
MIRCFIGLGANLDEPIAQITIALRALAALPDTRLLRCSSLYGSKPLGPQDQPDYVNAVAELETTLEPLKLLDALQHQEREQGRIKRRHWGERCIDLDLLLYGDQTMRSERLNIPHHEMHKRSFVLLPLCEIADDLYLPDGRAITGLTPEFSGDLQRIGPPPVIG